MPLTVHERGPVWGCSVDEIDPEVMRRQTERLRRSMEHGADGNEDKMRYWAERAEPTPELPARVVTPGHLGNRAARRQREAKLLRMLRK